MRNLVTALCAIAITGAFAAEAHAAPITVGSDLSRADSDDNGCEAVSCTRLLLSVDNVEVRSPIDGVVVRWRAVGRGTVRLRLVRRNAGGTWSAGPASDFVTFPAGSDRGEWTTRVPIAAGDFIGVDAGIRSGVFVAPRCDCPEFPGKATTAFWLPRLEDGENRAPSPITDGLEALVNVDVERDHDRDGFGDDTQDCAPADAAVHENCGAAPPSNPSPAQEPPPAASPSPSTSPAPSTGPAPTDPSAPPTGAPLPATAPGAPDPTSTPRQNSQRCRVPSLRGRTVVAARRMLRARRCRLGAVTKVRRRGVRHGRILSQTPRAGRSMAAGTRVSVRVRA